MKQKTLLFICALMMGFSVIGCTQTTSNEETAPVITVEADGETPLPVESTEYPGPATPLPQTPVPVPTIDPETYPGPEQQPTSPPAEIPVFTYPDLEDGAELTWIQAQTMIMQGTVVQVSQTHSLKVLLTLKDGRTLITFEPALDDVFKVIEVCGEKCEDIVISTE